MSTPIPLSLPLVFLCAAFACTTRAESVAVTVGASKTISEIRTPSGDPMNWIGFHGGWGRVEGRSLVRGESVVTSDGMRSTYGDGALSVEITDSWKDGVLRERYTFKNTTDKALEFKTPLGIRVPFADDYRSGAKACLTARCHTHLWAEGSSAWICALRMNAQAPHIGLVLTSGALDGYSIANRMANSNDRGAFVVHPAFKRLAPGESAEIAWTVFSHDGWDDFFAKAKKYSPDFTRVTADHYCVPVGETIRLTADGVGGEFTVNGKPLAGKVADGKTVAELKPDAPGELAVEWRHGARIEKLNARAMVAPDALLRARAEFLMDKKQVIAPGSPHDGAFPPYDTEAKKQVVGFKKVDWNSARERLGSGIVLGLLWTRTPDGPFRDRLKERYLRFYDFINREIQGPDGLVHDTIRLSGGPRCYDFPWAMRAHLVAWELTGDKACLVRLAAAIRSYYAQKGHGGGLDRNPVGIPILDSVAAFRKAGMTAEADTVTGFFRKHADYILSTGINIPNHEVAYEQGIAGPIVQILLETYSLTGDAKYLEGVKLWMPKFEAFDGLQPDYHLHDIGIRHWDGFWFGKRRTYGDTMPHYWTSVTAEVYYWYAKLLAQGAEKAAYNARARDILLQNAAVQFDADGAGHCAYLYPRYINGRPGRFNDPLDNDQDWTLVSWLLWNR